MLTHEPLSNADLPIQIVLVVVRAIGDLDQIYTGQRQGDLLRLPWSAYDGVAIK